MRKLLALLAVVAVVLAACGGSDSTDSPADDGGGAATLAAPDVANGEDVFTKTCVSCHGPAGAGIEGLGKPMPGSAFITAASDGDLVDFIKVGRGSGDPENTTGVDMPAKGGNPSLSEQDLVDVVAYIRTLN